MSSSFVHLHCHTEYSLLDGMSKVPDLCKRVAEIGQTAVAVTDHGWMAAAVKFEKEAKEAGIKPIVGSELYISTGSMEAKATSPGDNYHLTVLAQNEVGYRNLIRLSTHAHLRGFHYKPRVDLETLAAHGEGLLVLSGCIQGQVCQHLVRGEPDKARRLLDWYAKTFPGRFFVEVMYHGCGDDGRDLVRVENADTGEVVIEEYEMAAWLAEYADRHGLPVVATNDAHYLTRDDGDAHDTLLCLGMGAWKHKGDRMHYPGEPQRLYEFYVKTHEEMLECSAGGFWDAACLQAGLVADLVDEEVIPKGQLIMPKYEIPRDPRFLHWRRTGTLV